MLDGLGPSSGLICDPSPRAAGDFARGVRRLSGQETGLPPMLFRLTLDRVSARELVKVGPTAVLACVSIRAFDDLSADALNFARSAPTSGAEFAMLGALESYLAGPLAEVIVGAIAVGKKRVPVGAFARLLGIPERTLDSRLKRWQLPPASFVLGWTLALHTIWRTDVLGWTLKRAALTAGFAAPERLADYVERHVGRRPSQLTLYGGFPQLLDRFLGVMRGDLDTIESRPSLRTVRGLCVERELLLRPSNRRYQAA
jgi:hypothetical protein